LKTNAILIIF